MSGPLIMNNWQCRWAPSLGALEDTHQNVWGTKDYENNEDPTVFFGLYGLPDFYALWRHKGKKAILWAGTDITHLKNGYWLDELGRLRIDSAPLAEWINRNCESYSENQAEHRALAELGIESTIVPSFLGQVDDFQIEWEPSDELAFYSSVSGDNFEQYGWRDINILAERYPHVKFHLYGNRAKWYAPDNVIVHGRVPKEQMNEEVKKMTGAIRLTKFDGFSEILAKSVLWGQWPISPYIEYPYIAQNIEDVENQTNPNVAGHNYYRSAVNRYPWNVKLSN